MLIISGKNKWNKRGDIPVYILIFGVLAMCGLLLISFSISINDSRRGFSGLEILGGIHSLEEEFQFYKNSVFGKEPVVILDEMKTKSKQMEGSSGISYEIGEEGGIYSINGIYNEKSIFSLGKQKQVVSITRYFGWKF